MLSNPGNPIGVVYTKSEIDMTAKLAKKYNLFIISDKVYREFVYDGFKFTSFGNIKEIEDRVIIADSISKRYSACGARIGSIASKNKKLIEQILKLCRGRLCDQPSNKQELLNCIKQHRAHILMTLTKNMISVDKLYMKLYKPCPVYYVKNPPA